MPKKRLTRAEILDIEDLKREEIDVPEWGGSVFIREMRASEREEFERRFATTSGTNQAAVGKALGTLRASMLAMCIVVENGESMFTKEDITKLNAKSATVVGRLFQECMRISGMSQEAAKAIAGESDGVLDIDS